MLPLLFLTSILLCGCGDAASVYDQRQTGDLNVRLDLKDLHIFALMKGGKEEYVDYDYAYDYSEMTIKPSHGTTIKPLTTTTAATVKDKITIDTTATAAGIEQTTESIKKNITTEIAETQTTEVTLNLTVIDSVTTVRSVSPAINDNTTGTSAFNSTIAAHDTVPTVASNSTNCKRGFIQNNNGNCEFKIQSASNALLKIVKLSQKLKLRKEKKNEDDLVE